MMQDFQNCVDMTLLNEHIEHKDIKLFCTKVKAMSPKPACVCVYPRNIAAIEGCLGQSGIPIATVINFPHGLYEWHPVEAEIRQAISLNISELDIVVPYGRWLSHHSEDEMMTFAKHCRDLAGPKIKLKYILETGALQNPEDIEKLALLLCQHGADFIKTSTGKIVPGATLGAVKAIIKAVKTYYDQSDRKVGIKISGGIRKVSQANEYMSLIEKELGSDWLTNETFRIGTSRELH